MGIAQSMYLPLVGRDEVNIVMVGLDAAGKTTILYKLRFGDVLTSTVTPGFDTETVNFKNINFTSWDLGGNDRLRPLYKHYFQNTQAVVFVVDSSDRARIGQAEDELAKIVSDEELKDAVLLVLANKQDLPNAMTADEVSEKLKLKSMQSRKWHIQTTCAVVSDGLEDGIKWLGTALQK